MALTRYQLKMIELISNQPDYLSYNCPDNISIEDHVSPDCSNHFEPGPINVEWIDTDENLRVWRIGPTRILNQLKSHYPPHTFP